MKTYTEEQLIAFGNYLLSDYRKTMVNEDNQQIVHHADVENFNNRNKIRIECSMELIDNTHIFTTKFYDVQTNELISESDERWEMAKQIINSDKQKAEGSNDEIPTT
jgi:hypothetical protein